MADLSQMTKSKRILLLSDNANVAKLINHITAPDILIERFLLNLPDQPANVIRAKGCALIILALSVYAHEPIIVLAKTALLGVVGHIPILIISVKPFKSDPTIQVIHMDLPFSIAHLNNRVRDILCLPQVPLDIQTVNRNE